MAKDTSKAWQHENYLKNILSWEPPEVLTKYSPLGFLGLDKYGGTVAILPYGRIDAAGLLLSAKIEDHARFTVQTMEKSKVSKSAFGYKVNRNYECINSFSSMTNNLCVEIILTYSLMIV